MPRNGEETGVEIKITFDDQQVAAALDELSLDGQGEPRRIGFLEDTTVGSRCRSSTRGSYFESARSTAMTTTLR